jgi:hypothetical protein
VLDDLDDVVEASRRTIRGLGPSAAKMRFFSSPSTPVMPVELMSLPRFVLNLLVDRGGQFQQAESRDAH